MSRNIEDIRDKALRDSLNGDDTKYAKHKIDAAKLGVKIVTVFMAGAMTVIGTVAAVKLIHNFQDREYIDSFLTEYYQPVNDGTKRTADKQNYFYDDFVIAREIEDSNDPSLALYATYTRMGKSDPKDFEKVLKRLGYNSTEEFFKYQGGEDKYVETMSSLILETKNNTKEDAKGSK